MITTLTNGKSLSNNCDLLFYYKEYSGKDLMQSITERSKFLIGKVKMETADDFAKLDSEERAKFIGDFNVADFLKNIYFAGRAAFEDRLIPLVELKNELTVDVLLNRENVEKLTALVSIGSELKKK